MNIISHNFSPLASARMEFRDAADNSPALIWMAGEDGLCNWFNRGWLEFTGRSMAQEIGNGWAEGIYPQDIELSVVQYLKHFKAHESFLLEYRLRRSDGQYRWILDSGSPVFDPKGTFLGYNGVCFDIHERKESENAHNEKLHNLWELEKKRVRNKENQHLEILNALALEKDDATGFHIVRTQAYVRALANRLKLSGHYLDQLSERDIDNLFRAAPLHDIGKMAIPDYILKKSGKLTEEEWSVMQTHARVGEDILNTALKFDDDADDDDVLHTAIEIAGGHHEKWDGTGYPRGLKGLDIPLPARIMALADVYDALVSERVYKSGWSHEDAVKEIVSKRGIHFDPLVVDALIEEQSNFQEIAKKYLDN